MSIATTSISNKRFYFHPELAKSRKAKETFNEEVQEEKEAPQKTFTRKVIKGEGTGYKGPVYICPLAKTSFRGGCPIIPCHANITTYKPKNSCCIHIEAGKIDFDKWDLQEHLGIKESKLYRFRENGERKITCIIMLSKILNYLRETCKVAKPETKDIQNFTNFINNSYLGIHEVNSHLSDVGLIKNNLDKVYEFISRSKQNISLADLLGTDQPLP